MEAFLQRLFIQNFKHKKRDCIKRATRPGAGNCRGIPKKYKKKRKGRRYGRFDGFTISHYADDVTYDASKFIAKNMEILDNDTIEMCNKSTNNLLKNIGGNLNNKYTIYNERQTVTSVFNDGIKILIRTLRQTTPCFITCINPNMQKSCTIWNEDIVEYQLRCYGIGNVCKLFKHSYPVNVSYDILYNKCHHKFKSHPLMKNMNSETLINALLIAFDIEENYYKLGLTKIYFKSYKAHLLDDVLAKSNNSLTKEQVNKIKQWLIQKRICQLIGACKAILKLKGKLRVNQRI
eukprot:463855_1